MARGFRSTTTAGAGSDLHELGDSPWPVYARKILTRREESLHQHLLAAFPDCIVHAQVALSQLIDVPEDHPERASIRNRFSQLVADFVLYRQDLSVIAVIELDDRSHERADRKYADARKGKALGDAGLRLIRIPSGTVPTAEQLVDLIGQLTTLPSPERIEVPPEGRQEKFSAMPFGQLDERSADWLSDRRPNPRAEESDGEVLSELLRPVLQATGVILLGWVVYWQLLHSTAAPLHRCHTRSRCRLCRSRQARPHNLQRRNRSGREPPPSAWPAKGAPLQRRI